MSRCRFFSLVKIFYKKRNNSGTDSGDRAGFWLSYAAFLVIAGTVLLFCMILAAALPAFFEPGPGSPFGWTWQPYQESFGILPMCLGSLALASFALILGWPLALSVCGFLLTEESPSLRPFRKASSVLVRFMTTIPTVVYGFAAVFLLTPLIRRAFGGSGMCLLAAGLILTLEILPTMVLVMQAGLSPRLSRLCPCSAFSFFRAHAARSPLRPFWASAGPQVTRSSRLCSPATLFRFPKGSSPASAR